MLLPPATKLGQGYVFTGVCDSVHRGGMHGCWGACVVAGGACVVARGHVWLPGGACVAAGECVWWLGGHAWDTTGYGQ